MKRVLTAVAAVLAAGLTVSASQALKVDAALTPYHKASGVSGSLSSVGSDSMNNNQPGGFLGGSQHTFFIPR